MCLTHLIYQTIDFEDPLLTCAGGKTVKGSSRNRLFIRGSPASAKYSTCDSDKMRPLIARPMHQASLQNIVIARPSIVSRRKTMAPVSGQANKMLRREARLRKEFLYRKSLEESSNKQNSSQNDIQKCLTQNMAIPKHLRADSVRLAQAAEYDHGLKEIQTSSVDDEYSRAGISDPKILITTSRDPSSRLLQFAKELKLIVPNSQRMNRGSHVVSDLSRTCKQNDITDLIIIHENRGKPDGLIISHFPHGPTAFFSLSNVVLRHDVEEISKTKISEAYPHLIFSGFSSKVGNRTVKILKHLFPVPKPESKRVISYINKDDFISFRHHSFTTSSGNDPELDEIGPRFEMKLYQIRLGPIDIADADIEWVYRPYLSTARKNAIL